MKNNLEARTRLISEEKLNREMAMRRFEKANKRRVTLVGSAALVIIIVGILTTIGYTTVKAYKTVSQVSLHNYCMEHDCLVTPEAVKYMENEGHGKVLTEMDIE